MRSSAPLYDRLAADYDAHFAVLHRRAYDTLAWEAVEALLPDRPGLVIDAGAGVGRWSANFAVGGHSVIAVDQSREMARHARARLPKNRCTVLESSLDAVELPDAEADLVVAMGSVQYTRSPEASVARFARWTRPGGAVAVLVDSLVAMAVEKIRAGAVDAALAEVSTRRGTWTQHGIGADLHLLDRTRLEAAFQDVGLTDVVSAGLLVSASTLGLQTVIARLDDDWEVQLACERRLMAEPALADLGKQLLVTGRVAQQGA